MSYDSIIFDLDGTLWDSVDEIVVTWNSVISRYPGLRPAITRKEQESVMGLQMDEIARRLFPQESLERQSALMTECVTAENEYLYSHGARLYPDVPQTLFALKQKYRLFIVSNCQSGYIEAFLHAHDLEPLFDGFLCYGDTGRGKSENIASVVRQYGLQHPAYVGDTQGDALAAENAGIPFIFARYGFGRVEHYEAAVDTFSTLRDLLKADENY